MLFLLCIFTEFHISQQGKISAFCWSAAKSLLNCYLSQAEQRIGCYQMERYQMDGVLVYQKYQVQTIDHFEKIHLRLFSGRLPIIFGLVSTLNRYAKLTMFLHQDSCVQEESTDIKMTVHSIEVNLFFQRFRKIAFSA